MRPSVNRLLRAFALVVALLGIFVMSNLLIDMSHIVWSKWHHGDETVVRMNQIKAETVPIAMGLVELRRLSRENAERVINEAHAKGVGVIVGDLDFLDGHMDASDPDRPNVRRTLQALKEELRNGGIR